MYSVKDATEENVDKSILKDSLGRLKSVLIFIRFLDKLDEKTFIGIDGAWGCGKTFFVKQTKRILEVNQKPSSEKKKKILDFVKKEFNTYDMEVVNNIIPIYYDAWQNDDDIDPILSIVNRIVYESRFCVDVDLFKSIEYREVTESILGVFSSGMKQLAKGVRRKNILQYYEEKENIKNKIYELFKKIRESQGIEKIVVFIDELDRCKPDFALKLLERIKHYVDDKNVIFVISTNLTELQHMINNVYGNGFSSTKYFDRFFDYLFSLPVADVNELYKDIGYKNQKMELNDILRNHFISKYNLEPREIIRYVSWCELIIPNENNTLKSMLNSMFLPYMIGVKKLNITNYNDFIVGDGFELYKDFLDGLDIRVCFGSLVDNGGEKTKDEVVIERIKSIYQYIFTTGVYNKDNSIYDQSFKVCNRVIPVDSREYLLNKMSMLT